MEEKESAQPSGNVVLHVPQDFFLVALGASAGGLKALVSFFEPIPEDSGLAFVVVTHLAPDRNSILASLVQKSTKMPVLQVEEGMKVVPNTVYVIPPNREMVVDDGVLKLSAIDKNHHAFMPIDTFFRSLASDWGDKGVGIILSGLGTDGSLGIREIKSNAGIAIAQTPDSAQFDGMPQSAINTGAVDFVLPPEEMTELLLGLAHQTISAVYSEKNLDEIKDSLNQIFSLLLAATGHDFSSYKTNTICRRIERRMQVNQIVSIANYVRYLEESEREVQVLFKELLIGVTSFFRDINAYSLLQQKFLPELLKDKPADYPVRVWAPGCSTGEEAYSIAIILHELLLETGRQMHIQIFATDLDEDAINKARSGTYPESIAADVSRKRLQQFFVRTGHEYKICKTIRESVVFALQNIVKDPPFTKLDLLCCRNLFIYFTPELQKKLLPVFHYCLKKGGLLFLGSSESVGTSNDLFLPLDKKWKIFQRLERKDSNVLAGLHYPRSAKAKMIKEPQLPMSDKDYKDLISIKLLKAILAQSDVPSCVVIDEEADIMYIHGRTGRYLEPAEGLESHNIVEMARSGLKAALANAIHKMDTERKEVVLKNLKVNENGTYHNVNVTIRPLPDFYLGQKGVMLVFFEDEAGNGAVQGEKRSRKSVSLKKNNEVKKLQEELVYTKEYLQATIEELESANEELKSTNEELQSTNEELQSTNEELETSKEELQSLNEESATINTELQSRIDELVAANDDIKNLLDATDIATLFLDINLNVRRFTAKIGDIYPLTVGDVGRPISHFNSNLDNFDLLPYAEKVLKDLEKQELEVIHQNGTIFRMRLRPYRTVNNVIDGVVITFEDMTEIKTLLGKTKGLSTIVQESSDAVILYDFSGKIIQWNKSAETIYGYSAAEALQMNVCEIWGLDQDEEFARLIAKLRNGEKVPEAIVERKGRRGDQVQVLVNTMTCADDLGGGLLIVSTERDLSSYKSEAVEQLRRTHDA